MLKLLLVGVLIIPVITDASSFGIPDGDTGLLISIVGNTSEQITRLEKLLSNSEKQLEYTKKLKETSEALESSYDRLTSIQNALSALSNVGNTNPENLKEINDKIEEIQDQKQRILDLLEVSKNVEATSEAISKDSSVDQEKVKEIVKIDKEQIKRSHSGSVKNQSQETAKNTAYMNSKLTETNILLRKNTETNAQTNALLAKKMAKDLNDEQKELEYLGILSNEKKGKQDVKTIFLN